MKVDKEKEVLRDQLAQGWCHVTPCHTPLYCPYRC